MEHVPPVCQAANLQASEAAHAQLRSKRVIERSMGLTICVQEGARLGLISAGFRVGSILGLGFARVFLSVKTFRSGWNLV